jgi:ribosomal protein S12 methylthiotransferase accessory factor
MPMTSDPGTLFGLWCSVRPSDFVPTPLVSESGHARSLEETYAWVKPLLRRVPITRVLNATPLDSCSLPVWAAITPLAKDLTVHAGKGRCPLAARLSAIMEAIERTCAESMPEEFVRRASYDALVRESGLAVLNPESLNLPFETSYTPERTISWTLGYDIARTEYIWTPVDAVISPPEDSVCNGVETNGLAAGNTVTEALLHALYEIIERDASALEQFCELHADAREQGANPVKVVDPTHLPEISREWIDRLNASGLRVVIQDLTGELQIPVFATLIVDRVFPTNGGEVAMFVGHGCDLDSRKALFRAITEATQGHSIALMGARDAFEGTRPLPNRAARLRRRLDVLAARTRVPFCQQDFSSNDLWINIQCVLRRLVDAGMRRCIVVGLTRADLGVPVVRVIVPGMEFPYGHSMRRPGIRLLRNLV